MEGRFSLSGGRPSSNLRMVDWVPLKAHEAFTILVWHHTVIVRQSETVQLSHLWTKPLEKVGGHVSKAFLTECRLHWVFSGQPHVHIAGCLPLDWRLHCVGDIPLS